MHAPAAPSPFGDLDVLSGAVLFVVTASDDAAGVRFDAPIAAGTAGPLVSWKWPADRRIVAVSFLPAEFTGGPDDAALSLALYDENDEAVVSDYTGASSIGVRSLHGTQRNGAPAAWFPLDVVVASGDRWSAQAFNASSSPLSPRLLFRLASL